MFSSGKIKSETPTSASYATHKHDYKMEAYLIHVRIKTHRNSFGKLRLSDNQLHIQTGRQKRQAKTPAGQNTSKSKDLQNAQNM